MQFINLSLLNGIEFFLRERFSRHTNSIRIMPYILYIFYFIFLVKKYSCIYLNVHHLFAYLLYTCFTSLRCICQFLDDATDAFILHLFELQHAASFISIIVFYFFRPALKTGFTCCSAALPPIAFCMHY